MQKETRMPRTKDQNENRHARICHLILKGFLDDEPTKAEQRQAASEAAMSVPIIRIPQGKRTRSKPVPD